MLQVARILSLGQRIVDFCESKDILYNSSMISNGVNLTFINAKDLMEVAKVKTVQITMDGYGEEHNRSRPMKNGDNSFEQISSNIDSIIEFFGVTLRINVSKENVDGLERLLEYIIDEKKWHLSNNFNLYIAPVTNCQEACDVDEAKMLRMSEFSELYSWFLKYLHNRECMNLILSKYPRKQSISCSAESVYSFVISPTGDLYKCLQDMGYLDRRIGNITKGVEFNETYFHYVASKIPGGCESCKALPLCQGGCLAQRMKNSNSGYCYVTKENIGPTLKTIYRIWENEK